MRKRMRVVLLTSDSPWQRALACRIDAVPELELAGITVQAIKTTARWAWIRKAILTRPGLVAKKAATRLLLNTKLREIHEKELRWFGEGGRAREWPQVERLEIEDINAVEVVEFLERLAPDVVAVSGTRIIRDPLFNVKPPPVFLNLHTGLSPYYKGGPNCTLWALSRREPDHVGATIHVLDPGIDTGAILLSEFTDLEGSDTLGDAVCRVVDQGHDMYIRVLRLIAGGARPSGVKQDALGTGRTFYSREWGPVHLWRASEFLRSGGLMTWVSEGRPRDPNIKVVNAFELDPP